MAPDTVEVVAPVMARPAPRQKTVERTGSQSVPFVRQWPEVRVGICEHCGVIDRNVESQFQYKLCEHYRGMNLRCSYCPDSKDPDEVNGHTVLHIYEHPDNPDKFIICCDSYECSLRHQARFKRN